MDVEVMVKNKKDKYHSIRIWLDYAAGAYVDKNGIQYSGGVVERAFVEGALCALGSGEILCSCIMIQQDETCPVGYPSLLCEKCDGKGHILSRKAYAQPDMFVAPPAPKQVQDTLI